MAMDDIFAFIEEEAIRQHEHLELIASENFASENVRKVGGSILTNKYAEGYPGRRYYGGCKVVDKVETEAIERAKQLFGVKFANVQPHSGSNANQAVFRALLKYQDTVLSMGLDHGGHLTHGHSMSFSGEDYHFVHYGVHPETYRLDYDEIRALAIQHQPKLIITGYSSYPRTIDFAKFREIADEVGAKLMVDMAHIAGLVAAGVHPHPFPYADVVTTTTHKTLRGPRGGLILTNDPALIKTINSKIFPGIQGGPLMHIIGAKAVAFLEAMDPLFVEYQKQVIKNAAALAQALENLGYVILTGGTDNHLLLVNVKKSIGMTGKDAENILESINITCNKNAVPFDDEGPFVGSGIRLGTPALTTRGMKEKEMEQIAILIDRALKSAPEERPQIKEDVLKLVTPFPLP
jgi:glycine hydroxymethyltransferase